MTTAHLLIYTQLVMHFYDSISFYNINTIPSVMSECEMYVRLDRNISFTHTAKRQKFWSVWIVYFLDCNLGSMYRLFCRFFFYFYRKKDMCACVRSNKVYVRLDQNISITHTAKRPNFWSVWIVYFLDCILCGLYR